MSVPEQVLFTRIPQGRRYWRVDEERRRWNAITGTLARSSLLADK